MYNSSINVSCFTTSNCLKLRSHQQIVEQTFGDDRVRRHDCPPTAKSTKILCLYLCIMNLLLVPTMFDPWRSSSRWSSPPLTIWSRRSLTCTTTSNNTSNFKRQGYFHPIGICVLDYSIPNLFLGPGESGLPELKKMMLIISGAYLLDKLNQPSHMPLHA